MSRLSLGTSLLLLFLFGCATPGPPVVGVSKDGVHSYHKGEIAQTYPWDEIEGLVLGGQLNAKNNKSYPVLRLRTKERSNQEIASSYSEYVDVKAYAGLYIHLSISAEDLDKLKEDVIKGAGLSQHPEDKKVWIKAKGATGSPPAEAKIYNKKIGG